MRYLILLLVAATAACSSSAPSGVNGSSPNANAAVNVPVAENPTTVTYVNGAPNLNPNAFNSPTVVTTPKPYTPKEGELPYGQRPAPDESVVFTEGRGKFFVETRLFKNDPTLAKVEKITDGPTTVYKVYLKSGKVVDGPADKLQNYLALAPLSILEAIGVTPKLPPPTNQPPGYYKKENR